MLSSLVSLFRPHAFMLKAFNALLAQEDWALERVSQHAGKTIRIAFGNYVMALSLNSDGTASEADETILPNATVSLPQEKLTDFFKGVTGGQGVHDVADMLHIEGEAGLVRLVADLARDLRWDKQHQLAAFLGPILAARLISIEESVRQHTMEGVTCMSEHLSDKQGILVSALMVNDLSCELQDLTERTRRLEQNLHQLNRIHTISAESDPLSESAFDTAVSRHNAGAQDKSTKARRH